MRFNFKMYEELFPRFVKSEEAKSFTDPDDQMTTEVVEVKEEKEETADGDGTDSQPDTE